MKKMEINWYRFIPVLLGSSIFGALVGITLIQLLLPASLSAKETDASFRWRNLPIISLFFSNTTDQEETTSPNTQTKPQTEQKILEKIIEKQISPVIQNLYQSNPISYSAGSGIGFDGYTIFNEDKGSSQITLKSITVEGDDTVQFNRNSDSVTFVAGDNISIDANASEKKITFSGSGGGTTFNTLHEVGDKIGIGTTSPQNTLDVNGNVSLSDNSRLYLSTNTPDSGSIARLLTLSANNKYERPWISHLDYTGRHAAAFGIHHTNIDDDDVHKRWELKTSADPNGSTPNTMLTRFAIDYDTDLANIILGDIATVGTHNDYGDRAVFVHNMKTSDGSQDVNVGQWTSELGDSDSTVMSFDAKTLAGDTDATIRFFRETNTTGQRRFVIMKGDNTSTETVAIDASTGTISTFANDESMNLGDGTNTTAYSDYQSNRTMVGYDGSNAVIQGGTSKGIKFNVNSSSFGAGTIMTIEPDGDIGVGTTTPSSSYHIARNSESLRLGDNTNVASFINIQGNRAMTGYDGSYAVLQGGTNKGIKFNVNSSSFGAGTAMTITSAGDVGFGVTPTLGPIEAANGAYLSVGGTWENTSDRNKKQDFELLDPQEILQKIAQLPALEWSYISEGSSVRHIGPIAQDFYSIFNLGDNDTSISSVDPAGVALVGIKGLLARVEQLEEAVKKLISDHEEQGTVLIPVGQQTKTITFSTPFEEVPVVIISPNQAIVSGGEASDFFDQSLQYTIAEVTNEKFVIQLSQPTNKDIGFSWSAQE